MLFFKRILRNAAPANRRRERRVDRRVAIGGDFPLQSVLIFSGRGGTIAPMSTPGGWDWPGKLLDCSADGARIRLPVAALAVRGDFCDLDLRIDGSRLVVPCQITNVRVERDGAHFGLRFGAADKATRAAYLQFVAIVTMGATLKVAGRAKVDGSGYAVETYAGDGSQLTVWREKNGRKAVSAAEFVLSDCTVRIAKGQLPACLVNGRTATPAKAAEIAQLFRWILPNLSDAVPADVQKFLRDRSE